MNASRLTWIVAAVVGVAVLGVVAVVLSRGTPAERAPRGGDATVSQPAQTGPTADTGPQVASRAVGRAPAAPAVEPKAKGQGAPAPAPRGKIYPASEEPQRPGPFTTKEQWVEELAVGQLEFSPQTIERNRDILDELAQLHGQYVVTIEKLREERQKAFEQAHAEHYTEEQAKDLDLRWKRQTLPHEQALLENELRILEKLRPRLGAEETPALDKLIGNLSRLFETNKKLESDAQ